MPRPPFTIMMWIALENIANGSTVYAGGAKILLEKYHNEEYDKWVYDPIEISDTEEYRANGRNKITGSPFIKLFPNPASTVLFIELDGKYNNPGSIEIIDPIGKVFLYQDISGGKNLVNISGLNPGIYFCEFVRDGNPVCIQKLIINR